jgi:tRNA dimethylallyltransferase
MLIVICGATATGKSGLALELAQKLNTIIISADSRQVYREFDIGTAKPSITEQKLVPHYLIDICDPTDNLTLAEYQSQAEEIIKKAGGRRQEAELSSFAYLSPQLPTPNSPTFLVGGTGLYIKSITRGLKIPRVSPQPELRSQLESLGQKQLYSFLCQVDPVAAQKIHPNDSVRTLRALEVFYVTGYPISAQQGENPPNYPILQIGLDCNPEVLQERIQIRTQKMIDLGLIKEVEDLISKYGEGLPLLNTLGYGEIKQYLIGNISLDEAINLTILHTRQFAKRQRTWFNAYPEIEWFDTNSSDLKAQVWQKIQEFINDE